MSRVAVARPGPIGRLRSRQSGLPSGLLGRFIGRAMVQATADDNDRALAMLDLGTSRTVLEVGFGQGRTVQVLAAAGHRVLGVDPSPTMVSQARARNRRACRDGQVELRHGDGITIPFPTDSADAAITVHTVYFMDDPAATIAAIARVLRPGGTLVIACRTSERPPPAWMDPQVYRLPTADSLTAMLRAAGFGEIAHQISTKADHDVHLLAARLTPSPTKPMCSSSIAQEVTTDEHVR